MVNTTRAFNTWDIVKLLALAFMFIDHSGAFYYTDEHWIRAIGRGAAPIFLFLPGFAASYKFKWDLFALALLMTCSDLLLTGYLRTQNILVTILIARMVLAYLDRHGKPIKHPYQWLFGALAWLATMIVTLYGSFGLMFALCGYVKRRPEHYSKETQNRMLMFTLVCFGIVSHLTFGFIYWHSAIMTAVLIFVYYTLSRLEIRDIDNRKYPRGLLKTGKIISAYSGYIYAFHLIILEWVTGIPF